MKIEQGQSTIERAYLLRLRDELQDEFSDADWNIKLRCANVDCNPLSVV